MNEIIDYIAASTGITYAHLNKRVRELNDTFDVQATHVSGRKFVYPLLGWQADGRTKRKRIPGKVRGRVLAPQRCAQCGKRPLADSIKLEVDHKLPLAWGGTDDVDNLQPLCEECNHDKRDYYATFDAHATEIRAAASLLEPHKRIGETLKAFKEASEYAPSEVVGLVACMIQYQEDWQKRMRELRELGWDYKTHKKKEHGRMRSYYELTAWKPWPSEPVAPLIRQIEKDKKLAKQQASS